MELIFKLYILFTIFLGNSLSSFLGINLEANSFLSSIHFRTLPFLVLFFLFQFNKISFLRREIYMFVLCFCMIIVAGLMDRSAMFAVLVNNAIEPILLIALLRRNNKCITYIRNTLIVFFIFECSLAWIEVITKTIIFADTSMLNNYQYMIENEMRAWSLHGHPLQNAFIVSILSYFFLASKGKLLYRYGLFFIGYITLFAFNTRSSIYLMGIIGVYLIFKDLRSNNLSNKQKNFVIILIGLAVCFLSYMIVKYQFGNRLFEYSLSTKDDSSNTRYMLLNIIGNMPLKEFLFGMDDGLTIITRRYSLLAIENSLANFIITNGFIFTILWCILIYLCLKTVNPNRNKYNLSFIIFFALLNANNALMTDTPIIIFYILSLYSLNTIQYKKTNKI